jgi:predicted DCC family thiol-disulfide oxidoreductase YuxK
MLLLNPGPVTLTERVRRSLLQPDLCHRESEFFDLQDEARTRLLATHDLDPNEWTAVLMTASGTAAVESMVAALVPQAGRVLVIANGSRRYARDTQSRTTDWLVPGWRRRTLRGLRRGWTVRRPLPAFLMSPSCTMRPRPGGSTTSNRWRRYVGRPECACWWTA